MSIRVETGRLAALRKTLHQWLGASLDIYTAVIDNKSAQACLQVEIAASRIADVMSVVMRALPEAEFGTIRPSPRTAAIQH
jgi:hypothetical protein